jgi:hypothetical protein
MRLRTKRMGTQEMIQRQNPGPFLVFVGFREGARMEWNLSHCGPGQGPQWLRSGL